MFCGRDPYLFLLQTQIYQTTLQLDRRNPAQTILKSTPNHSLSYLGTPLQLISSTRGNNSRYANHKRINYRPLEKPRHQHYTTSTITVYLHLHSITYHFGLIRPHKNGFDSCTALLIICLLRCRFHSPRVPSPRPTIHLPTNATKALVPIVQAPCLCDLRLPCQRRQRLSVRADLRGGVCTLSVGGRWIVGQCTFIVIFF